MNPHHDTHWVPYDALRLGYRRQAICGVYVDEARTHAQDPTCPACQHGLREMDEFLDELNQTGRPAAE
jgi:hypothetical protein